MRNSFQKIESIQEKMKQLKSKQNEIEKELIDNFFQVLKMNDAFQLDFDAIVGGLLEVIDTIRSDPVRVETWRSSGHKFCKTKFSSKGKGIKNFDCKMEKDYD